MKLIAFCYGSEFKNQILNEFALQNIAKTVATLDKMIS